MRKTPSYLKGLAQTKARAAADVLRYQAIYEEVTERLADARASSAACDQLIKKFDPRLNPSLISRGLSSQ